MYEEHERLERNHWWFEGRRQIIREVMRRHLPPRSDRRLLDVGSGTGGMFPMLSEFGTVEGAESSPDARQRSLRRFSQFAVHACELPRGLPEGRWDVVTTFDVLEHLDEPVETLRAMRDRMSPDGCVVVTVPAMPQLWSHHDVLNEHRRRYTQSLLIEHLKAAGLETRFASHYNSLLLPAVAASRLVANLFNIKGTGDDIQEPPRLINAALKRLFGSERKIVASSGLPLGVSLIAVAGSGASQG